MNTPRPHLPALVVDTSMPREVVPIDGATATRIVEACALGRTLAETLRDDPVAGVDDHSTAAAHLAELLRIADGVEKHRVKIKARPLEVCRQIDEAVRPYSIDLDDTVRSLRLAIRKFEDRVAAERRRAEEAAAAARKAEEDRRRREAEEIAARKAVEVEAARLAAVTPEAAAAAEVLAASASAEVEAAAAAVEVLPAPTPVARPLAPSGIVRRTTERVTIDDASKVPISVAGVVVRVPDVEAIGHLLRAGIPVPGARLERVEVLSGGRERGRRSR